MYSDIITLAHLTTIVLETTVMFTVRHISGFASRLNICGINVDYYFLLLLLQMCRAVVAWNF